VRGVIKLGKKNKKKIKPKNNKTKQRWKKANSKNELLNSAKQVLKKKDNKIFGVLPIQIIKRGKRHPHVVVLQGKEENISVGLTTKDPRDDLMKVKYSNGKEGYMKRTSTRKPTDMYDSEVLKYNLDIESEKKAYEIAIRKILKDIGNKK